ncbi:hypothetical protein DDB_G0287679 [Dictyostelium discoideum AX4]|uniref:TSET complex member tstF n=1 Tax=Dictyostelium discoideum TaxID=44689 RepID=TSTF_DICDI|nr:hypothetical protein DDB_G0287679 [Dictyostelium discoideum AX4]Q54K14.1 RecName: Full=TSET complex member tstF; AltName: Full=Protein TTRAY2 [Dictyostelium discoideum]EAL63648.1 hypothetical protein DDB_G0287679 [Dictyostelium discoideum AX4]|eukprot:XP_637150.1 hypothetical protein DDB_G0287679 [Dictyostelium discoideum AX4]
MSSTSNENISSYVIFKSKGQHINTSYNPIDIHPIHPWIVYADSDSNIVIQNYQNNEKILNFSISQHDEEKKEQILLLQKKVPTLSALSSSASGINGTNNNNSGSNSSNNNNNNNGSLSNSPNNNNNVAFIGSTGGVDSRSASVTSIGSGGGVVTPINVNSNSNSNSPSVPTLHVIGNQTLHNRSPNNTIKLSPNSSNNDSLNNNNNNINNNSTNSNNYLNENLDKMKLGQIKFIYFYDKHTRSCKDKKPKISQNKLQNISKAQPSVGIEDYIVVVAENRIVFINYHSQRLREVKIPAFENKSPNSVEFFSNSPFVAFGGPDSMIRLWNTEKWEIEKQLAGHPKGTIVKLKAIEIEGEFLVSGGTDGFVCVWNVKTGSLATQFSKVHEIVDLSYDYVTGQVMALTQDRHIMIYDLNTLKEVSKVSCGKKEFFSIEAYYHSRFNQDLLLGMKQPAQVSFFSRSGSTKEYSIDLDALLNPSKKEKSKLYKVVQHPLQPHLLLCWLNKSVYIVSTLATSIPMQVTTFNSLSNDHTVYYPFAGYLYSSSLTNVLTCEKVQTPIQLSLNENYKLDISPSGKYLSIHAISSGNYQILEISTWKILEKGQALDVAWSGKGKDSTVDEKFGKLEKILESVDSVKKKKTLGILPSIVKSTKKEETVISKILLKTKEFNNNNVVQELLLHANEDRISGGLMLGVYHKESTNSNGTLNYGSGGSIGSGSGSGTISSGSSNLINGSVGGSSSNNSANSNNSNNNNNNNNNNSNNSNNNNNSSQPILEPPIITTGEETESKSFQLLDWWTLQPVGESLPPPLKIYWDQNQTHCAIAFTHYFFVFKLRPTFHMLCRWSLGITSAVWHNNTLFFSTHNDIQCIFPHKHESSPIILASSTGNVFPEDLYDLSSGSLSTSKPNQSFSTLPNIKPTGPISLIEVNNEGLVLLDSNYKFYCIPLTHYLLKFFILAQMEAIDLAMKCSTMVDPKYHYLMAKFLTVRGHPKECLQMNGISNFLKLQICLNNEAFETSLDIVPLITEAIKSGQSITNENNNDEEVTLSSMGKMCIEIGQRAQNKNEYPTAEKAFKLATSLEPNSAYQELALHYVFLKKMNELKELQQSISTTYPLESNLISLFLD